VAVAVTVRLGDVLLLDVSDREQALPTIADITMADMIGRLVNRCMIEALSQGSSWARGGVALSVTRHCPGSIGDR